MTMQLRKATRQKAKIRLGLSAASGGGKTYSALKVGKGLAGGDLAKVAIIDTENGSADLYAHMGEYLVLPLEPPYSPERYIEAIKACEGAGVDVIIIDSITHEWDGEGGVLRIADMLTGDSFTKWKILTPRHQAFVDAILKSKCHVITTVRRKQEYAMVKDEMSGKNRVEKLGLREVTREGFDYELTVNLELDQNHNAFVGKDRTELFAGKPTFVPSEETGRLLAEWCENGEDINVQMTEAIMKLSKCDTRDEILLLKETLPILVVNHADFKAAGNMRWNALAPAQAPVEESPENSQGQASETNPVAPPTTATPEENTSPATAPEIPVGSDASQATGDAPEETPNVELLRSEIKKAETPEELTRLHNIVGNLPAADKKSLSITVTTRGKNMGWVPNVELKCWETPVEAKNEALQNEPAKNETPTADNAQAPTPADTNTPSNEEKPLFDQLAGAADENSLDEIYTANAEQINASAPLTYIFKMRSQEIIESAIMEAFTKAASRNDLLQIYLEHQREIQKSPILTNLYEEARSKFPVEVSDDAPQKRSLGWFRERIGKTVYMHHADPVNNYTGPYKIEDDTFPEAMVEWQETSGFTFGPFGVNVPEGEKLD